MTYDIRGDSTQSYCILVRRPVLRNSKLLQRLQKYRELQQGSETPTDPELHFSTCLETPQRQPALGKTAPAYPDLRLSANPSEPAMVPNPYLTSGALNNRARK